MPVPNNTKKELFDQTNSIDLDDDTLKIALYDNSTAFSFDSETHAYVGDVFDGGTTAQELSGSAGYTGTSDRKALANVSVTQDNTDDEAVLDADDVTWTGVESTEDIQGYIIYRQVGADDSTPNDDEIIQLIDDADSADLPLTTNGSDVTVTFDAEGILNLA
jgi:hypothetical protein